MTLDEYLKPHGALKRLARQLGVSTGFLCDIRKGRRSPSLVLAVRISRATGVDIETLTREKVA